MIDGDAAVRRMNMAVAGVGDDFYCTIGSEFRIKDADGAPQDVRFDLTGDLTAIRIVSKRTYSRNCSDLSDSYVSS
jgi:hypothetical protein